MSGRKVFFWIGGTFCGVLLLLVALLLAAPYLINIESVHGDLEARFNRETGGQGTFRKLDLFFLPRPHAVIQNGKLSFPGRGSVTFEAATVYPKLLPLLKGEFLPTRFQVSSPCVDIAVTSGGKKQSPNSFPEEVAKLETLHILSTWIDKTGRLTIQVEKGLLNLTTDEKQAFQFSDITLSAEQADGSLGLELSCQSNLFKQMDLKGRMELTSFKTKGTLTLSGFRTDQLPDTPQHREAMCLIDGVIDLQANFEGMGSQSLKASLNLSAPSLELSRGPRTITVKGVRIEGDMDLGKGFLIASLSDMRLAYPPMNLSGVFKLEEDAPLMSLRLEGKDLEVSAARSCALSLAGDIPAVKDIFEIVRDGNVPSISVNAMGKSLTELSNLKAYTIEGRMQEGRISLKTPRLDLVAVSGNALISNGILSGQRLRANLGQIRGTDGILTVAFEDNAVPFHLDIQLDANLTEAHNFLKRIVTKGPFAEGLDHVRAIEGQATAGLKLDKNGNDLLAEVDCSSFHLKADYKPLPFPIIIEGGKVHYRHDHLRFGDLAGTYGQSRILEASGLFDWQHDLQMDITSASGTLCLEEAYSHFATMGGQPDWLDKSEGIKGQASFHSLHVKGPLEKPAKWQYETDFDIRNVSLEVPFIPGKVTVREARVTGNSEGARFNNAVIHTLDGELNLSGKLEGPPIHLKKFETALSGNLGPQSIQYLYKTFKIPEDFLLRTPLSIQSGRFLWEKNAAVSFDGHMGFPNGTDVSLSMSYGPSKLNIRNLAVKDGTVKASIGILAHEELVDINFSGKLQSSTLESIFAKNHLLDGWIEGDISARILPKQSFAASAEGFLKGEDIPFYGIGLPAGIEDFSLRAEGNLIHFDSVRMVLDQDRLIMKGNVDLSAQDPRFDVTIATENVDLDKILPFLEESDREAAHKHGKDTWGFPIRGTAHLMWDSLKIAGYTWKPFQGEINVAPESILVSVENASLCGISSPGLLRIRQDGIELNFQLKAEKCNLNQSITCLTRKRVSAEGTFDLTADFKGVGHWDNIFEKLEGPILFKSTDGQVKEDPALARVLSVLNLTDIFKGKLPTLEKDGLPYDSIQIKANLKDGKIRMEKGLMNSSAMNLVFHGDVDLQNERLDLNMLASPFTLTDRLIKLIPVAGYILGGTFISVPVKVDGPLKDPKVRILPLSEIGSGMWGMMKRTLETPFKIFEPFVGEEEKNKDDESIFW